MSDRIAVMRNGRIEQLGRPAEIYERPATRFVAGFIGSINMIGARIVGAPDGNGVARLETAAGPAHARLPAGAALGAQVTLTVRPERLKLGPPGGAPHAVNSWPATIERVIYLGARLELRLRLADGAVALAEAANDGATRWSEGQTTQAWFQPGDSWVIAEAADST